MKDERIIEEMVKLDAWFLDLCENYKDPWNNPHVVSKPNYLNSHDACQRVIDGMNDQIVRLYCYQVTALTGYTPHGIIKATPRQKCEAILRAYGKWEEL